MNWAEIKRSFSPAQRFTRDTLWNLASLAVLAIAGIVLNFLVARFWPKDALGVFNQVYAIYIVLSQLAVGGVHASVLRQVSYRQDDLFEASFAATAGLLLGILLTVPVCLIGWFAAPLIGRALDSEGVAVGLVDVLPALFFFSLNKILLNVLNGARQMRAYAVFMALRFFFILLTVVATYHLGIHYYHLAAAFSVAEFVLFASMVAYIRLRLFRFRIADNLRERVRDHFSFGIRGFLSGLISDLNTRIDAVMLGWYSTDSVVGLYSMASTLAEGFYQFPIVIQRNVNPLIGKAFAENDLQRIEWIARKTRRVVRAIMAVIAITAAVVYPFLMRAFFPDKGYDGSSWAFAFLLIGIVFQSGVAPVGGILFQGGRPGAQTILMLCVVCVNIILNAVLIPLMGINGAAIATATAYIAQGLLTLLFAWRHFGVRLWR